jgi:hypothetical protein
VLSEIIKLSSLTNKYIFTTSLNAKISKLFLKGLIS